MFKRKYPLVLLSALIILGTLAAPVLADSGTTTLVSETGQSLVTALPAVSADGRYVVFSSTSTQLVASDTNGKKDIFVRDLMGGTTLVSLASNGTQGDKDSDFGTISADGRYVAFQSDATNLVSGDTNNAADVFLHDLQTGTTTRVSLGSGGVQANSSCIRPTISANGRYVAFSSYATNLVNGKTNTGSDVFVRDLQTGTTTRISVATDGTQGNGGSYSPSISADGRYVAFESSSTNLLNGIVDNNYAPDIFLRDLKLNITTRVSVASDGSEQTGNFAGYYIGEIPPSISYDGRYVAFYSPATNLVSGDTNGINDVFVHDNQTGTTTLVSVAMGDDPVANNVSSAPSISADGRYVAFKSVASNLVADDINELGNEYPSIYDIFVRDLLLNSTTLVSVATNGAQTDHTSGTSSISADGDVIAFTSLDYNHLATIGDKGNWHVFAHEMNISSQCYSLTLESSGAGSIPSASPNNSPSCGSGQYTVGSFITLTANPSANNSVGSWSGTNYDTSTSTTNTATMPASSLTVTVNYVASSAPPTLTSLAPVSILAGSAAFTLTVHGADFVNGDQVYWDGAARSTTFVNSTQLTAQITAADVASKGSIDVTVFDPILAVESSALVFTITANPAPVVSSISPDKKTAGSASFTLTVTGSQFVSGSTVYWKGKSRPTTYVSSTKLTAAIPASDIATAGTATVTVYTRAPGGGTSASKTFTIVNPLAAPVLSSPSTGWLSTDTTPTFTWNKVTNAVKYRIQIDTASNFTHPVKDVTLGTGVITYTPAAIGVSKYYWRVAAVDKYGLSGKWATSRYFTIIPLAPKLSAPANSATVRGTPKYSWLASSGGKSYQFQYALYTTPTKPIYTSAYLTTLSITPPLQAPGVYSWHVRTRDAYGNWSAWSTAQKVTIKPLIPAAPVLVSPASAAVTTDTTPTFTWKTVPYGNKYRIQISKYSSFSTLVKDVTLTAGVVTYTSTVLGKGKYYWRVKAANVNGEWGTSWSSVRDFTIK